MRTKLVRNLVVLGATVSLLTAASPAQADVTVGGQVVRAGSCDVTLLSVTFDPATGQVRRVTGVQVTC